MLPKAKMGRTVIEIASPSNSESVVDVRLPQDLITEILVYLPVKSLVKFKCVSKPWLCLISSPQFIKSHFTTSSREGQYSNHQLLFNIKVPNSGMKHCSLSSALHNPCTNVSDIESPSRNPEVSLQIVGIVNGLVCLAIGVHDLYLWNPNLKKSKHLPCSNFSLKDCIYAAFGFGYDESNDDYKVFIALVNCIGDHYETNVKVYSVGADSWRRIEDFKGVIFYNSGTYANGKIWWAARIIPASVRKWKIVCLDMVSDKYEEVQGPVHEAAADNGAITVLGGRLCVLCYNYKSKLDLWVMDKLGVEESWSKMVSVTYDPANLFGMIQVLCISRNGEIVFVDGLGGLLVYSSKDKEFRKIQQVGGLRSFSQVFVYAESLVSLNGM